MKAMLTILIFVVFLETFATGQCPNSTWKHIGNKCYFVKVEEADFFENIALCNQLNASLTSIISEEENTQVMQVAKLFQGYWLGLGHKGDASKNFYWLDGRPFLYESWRKKPTFNHDKYWAAYFLWGQWSEASAFHKCIQMCSIDLSASGSFKKLANPSELQVDQNNQAQCPNTTWRRLGNKCIFFDTKNAMTYMENQALCKTLNATMVSIHSEAENIQLSRLFAAEPYWIGMKQVSRLNSSYEWEDESGITYESWQKGEPRDLRLPRVAYSSRGVWSTISPQVVFPSKPCCQILLAFNAEGASIEATNLITASSDPVSDNTESPSEAVIERTTQLPSNASIFHETMTASEPEKATTATENDQTSTLSEVTKNLIQLMKDTIGKLTDIVVKIQQSKH